MAAGDNQRGIGPGAARRALDVIVSALALLALLVPMLIVAIAVKTTSRGPVLFGQIRIGQGGREFRMLKFRTMREDASGSALTAPGDARITRIGRMLRATCLDELPQLLNILAGHMTLVGPRPQTPGFARRYPAHLAKIFRYRPGLTGPGVLWFNDEDVLPAAGAGSSDEIEEYYLRYVVPNRVSVDLDYCADPTLRRTIGLLWQTVTLSPQRFASRKPGRGVVLPAELRPSLGSFDGNGHHPEPIPIEILDDSAAHEPGRQAR